MAVTAIRHVRRLRGGSSPHLMQADDGNHYVVKFRQNSQHPRILVNELLSYVLLEYLNLPTPGWNIVTVPAQLIEESPKLTVGHGSCAQPPTPGPHFGSRYPDNPARCAVCDYLPLSVLRGVRNLEAFRGMLAFDKWVSNADGRQAIFYQERTTGNASLTRYVASMIDHGFAFNAHAWNFTDAPELGLYCRREVYENVTGYESFEPWLSRIISCPTSVLDEAYRQVPPQWLEPHQAPLEALFDHLYTRRRQVSDLLSDAKHASRDPFPKWSARVIPQGPREHGRSEI